MWLNGFNDNLPGFPKVECKRIPCPISYLDSINGANGGGVRGANNGVNGDSDGRIPQSILDNPYYHNNPVGPYGAGMCLYVWGYMCVLGVYI